MNKIAVNKKRVKLKINGVLCKCSSIAHYEPDTPPEPDDTMSMVGTARIGIARISKG